MTRSPGGGLDDIIHPEDHLGSFGGAEQHLALHLEGLGDAERRHVAHRAVGHVCGGGGRREPSAVTPPPLKPPPLTQSEGGPVLLVRRPQLGHQVGAVVAGVVGDDGRQLRGEEQR